MENTVVCIIVSLLCAVLVILQRKEIKEIRKAYSDLYAVAFSMGIFSKLAIKKVEGIKLTEHEKIMKEKLMETVRVREASAEELEEIRMNNLYIRP